MRASGTRWGLGAVGLLAATLALTACGGGTSEQSADSSVPDGNALVVYSGRSEALVAPLLAEFTEETGIDLAVRYGDTAELAAQILEEGERSPAGVFFSQDAGALQAVSDAGLLVDLPQRTLTQVPQRFRADDGQWVGISGRARVLLYNEDLVPAGEIPRRVAELTDEKWRGQVGVAPTNASFQSFVTAMRIIEGEERTKQWLDDLVANDVQRFENNVAIRDAVDAGQISLGLANHYYWFEKADEVGVENLAVQNRFMAPGDPGTLVNVAGVGILAAGERQKDAQRFADFLLDRKAQEYFAQETSEYPLVKGVEPPAGLPPLAEVDAPDMPLEQLADIAGTQRLLQESGLL